MPPPLLPGSVVQPPRLEVVSTTEVRADSPDAVLVARLRRGDHGASRELWDRYYSLVRGLLRRYFGPHDDVEDYVQEVFLRLFRKLGALRDDSALRSYIVGITMRVIRSEMRKHAIRTRLWWDYTQRVGNEQSVLLSAAGEEIQRLAGILDRVSDKVRFVFLMRYVEELSLPEIADALDVSLATAKRRVRAATDTVLKQAKTDPVLETYLYDVPDGEADGAEFETPPQTALRAKRIGAVLASAEREETSEGARPIREASGRSSQTQDPGTTRSKSDSAVALHVCSEATNGEDTP